MTSLALLRSIKEHAEDCFELVGHTPAEIEDGPLLDCQLCHGNGELRDVERMIESLLIEVNSQLICAENKLYLESRKAMASALSKPN